MKAVPKIGLDGLYIEDVLEDDSFTGVVPIYAQSVPEEAPDLPEEDVPEVPEPELPRKIIGYAVGIPLSPGLYLPRFDLVAWEAYQDAVIKAQSAFSDELHDWRESYAEGEEQSEEPIYTPPMLPDNLWIEGLTVDEIAELTKPGELSEIEELKKENILLKAQNNAITERADFIEDIIAEMAMHVYQ